ncbi:MAG: HEAT repeat domain-containing protein, partial [Acidobacteria bacterium]|nr:HEAT repeat domain-containing protein [Acidobacteriota bacterium]
MRKTTLLMTTAALAAALVVATAAACASGRGATVAAQPSTAADQNQKGVTPASFVRVEGADLSARLEAAARRARADNAQKPYWTAYSFDVRPGVAVDPDGGEFHGSMNGFGGIYVFSGTNSAGMTVETRNLGVFLLRSPSSNAITRMEVYNLDRTREYSGYQVYFTGRASNDESLNFLRGIAEGASAPSANREGMLNERATLAIALHDDPRVADLLKNFVRTSQNRAVRSSSVYWLGAIGGETQFLAGIVSNTNEDRELRKHAAHAIGESRDRAALTALQTLYDKTSEREIRQSIVHAAAENEDRDTAFAFVLRAARSDSDREVRKSAVHALGEFGERAVDELSRIYSNDADMDVRRTAVHALSEVESPRAEAKLAEIARDQSAPSDLRVVALHQLGERDTDAAAADLIKIYDADRAQPVRAAVLHSLSEMKSQRAEDKLFEVARSGEDTGMRTVALHML